MVETMSTLEETYTHPHLARVSHHLLGPPVAFAVAFIDGIKEGCREFRRSYRSIRSWHADVMAKDSRNLPLSDKELG